MIKEIRHTWCESDDRWVYLRYDENMKITGINYCQGSDYVYFKNNYCGPDKGLTEFYHLMVKDYNIEYVSTTFIGFINKVCWTYHTATAIRDGCY
jgi:hypothetical protein